MAAAKGRAVATLRHCGRRVLAAAALLGLAACASTSATARAGTAGNDLAAVLSGAANGAATSAGAFAGANARFAAAGVSRPEAAVRSLLASGDSSALAAVEALPDDALLRLLHRGMVHHRLGNWQSSNAAFQAAERLAEDRYTKSVSQALGSALINDKTLDYNPPPHERAFMHYYGMLNYLQLGDREAALVEARKANAFLERYTRENGHRTYAADAAVQYLAGLLQLAERNGSDAIVSLRKAGEAYDVYRARYGVPTPRFVGADLARTAAEAGMADVATETAKRFGLGSAELGSQAGSGQLLVLVENGYIAHRVEQKLYVPILGSEAAALSSGGAAAALTVGVQIVDRTLTLFRETNRGNEYAKAYQDGYVLGALVTGGDLFTVAWPKYALWANAVEDIQVTAGTLRREALVVNDLSAIAARHFEEDKSGILRRAVFRAAGKYALVKFGEKQAEAAGNKAGGWWGEAAKFGAGLAGKKLADATEQADTRSWSSLPAEIRAARFTLPPGEHDVTISVVDADGSTRTISLGKVRVDANEVVVRNAFVTGQDRGNARRFATALRGADLQASTAVASGTLPSAPAAGGAVAGATIAGGPPGAGAPAAPAGPGALATVMSVRPLAAEFRPLTGEAARFAVLMRNTPAAEKRGRAQLALYVAAHGGTDTAHVWSGAEGDTVFWSGTIGDRRAQPGQYDFVLRTTTPLGERATEYAWTASIEVDAPNGRELLIPPPEPKLEPETRTVLRPDYGKKRSRFTWGLVLTGIGAGTSAAGYSMAGGAIRTTPPGSDERAMAFNVWAGGIAVATIGTFIASRGWFKDYERPVQEPDGGAIQRNREAREARARALEEVEAANEKVKQSVVMRLRMAALGRGR